MSEQSDELETLIDAVEGVFTRAFVKIGGFGNGRRNQRRFAEHFN